MNPKDIIGSTKVSLSKIPPVALLHMALAHMNGAGKYGKFNWRDKAVQADIYVDAILRHTLAWYEREEVALDSGIHHLGHAMASAGILLDAQSTGKLVDNRPVNGNFSEVLERLNKELKEKNAS